MALASILSITADASSSSTSSSGSKLGFWQPLVNQPDFVSFEDENSEEPFPGGALNPLLLTDGSILVQNNGYWATGEIWKLTPDVYGSYVNGTWSQLASLPDGYIPTYFTSAVLADGRVIFLGGEYTGTTFDFTLTNKGAIYDPVTNIWTSIEGPAFFQNFYPTWFDNNSLHPVGDGASVVLHDGTFMINDKMSLQSALWNPKKNFLPVWTETGTATKQYMNTEEGWTLLPSGEVLTINCYKEYKINNDTGFETFPYPFDLTQSEIYNPKTGEWSYGGSTIFPLSDTATLSNKGVPDEFEMGPAVLRPDGTVFCAGSNGNTAIYDSNKQKWHQGPRLPSYPSPEYQLGIHDGPGALLPNGNVLFAASPLKPAYSPPLHFFVFDGATLTEQPTIPRAVIDPAYICNMLVLPTGQILLVDSSNDVEIYTPDDKSYDPSWAPVIEEAPKKIRTGKTYKIEGIRFNGMSQGAFYGDDFQMATNYPLVRITNDKTGYVYYLRTHDHSYMGVASDRKVHTSFDVPENVPSGSYKLEVVANGIPSKPVTVRVKG